jgi:hypothetical protein
MEKSSEGKRMPEKYKLTSSELTFTKADFIKRRLFGLTDAELNKIDLKMLEFHWQTLDVLRDASNKPMTQDEIMKAIKVKFEMRN